MSGAQGTLPTGGGVFGQAGFQTPGSSFNGIDFMVRQIIAGKAFAMLVLVVSCSNDGGISPVGTVSVQPMVAQVDGLGNQTPHGTVYAIPYHRVQGGANAIIIDPVAGDIGVAVMCHRDISKAKATKAVAGPGSSRQNDYADGLYLGGFLNGAPTQYVAFTPTGIEIVSPQRVTITAPLIALNGQIVQTQGSASTGSVTLVGPVNVTNDVTAGAISVESHIHSGVQSGGADTGPPV